MRLQSVKKALVTVLTLAVLSANLIPASSMDVSASDATTEQDQMYDTSVQSETSSEDRTGQAEEQASEEHSVDAQQENRLQEKEQQKEEQQEASQQEINNEIKLEETDKTTIPSVEYQAHVAKIGWQDTVTGGTMAGTTGKSLAIEALKINLTGTDTEELVGSGIEYSTHVQSYGWMDTVSNGEISGTTGKSKRVEAITISLTGPIAEKYDIYYRVHCQSYGWLNWAKNGEKAGTSGYSKRVEAIEIQLVQKDGQAPEGTGSSYVYPRITYQAHCQSYGWRALSYENQTAGTVGKSKRLEALKIQLPETKYEGGIQYRVYLQSYGWQAWKADGQIAGTVGESKRIEAVQIRLTGEMANYYDVYYSVHMAKTGWYQYASNGEITGTVNLSKPIQAIKICLVEKGVDTAPDTSGDKYVEGYAGSDFYYSAQIKDGTSTGNVAQGGTLGITGKSKQLQNLTLYLKSDNAETPKGEIQYATYVSGTGWTDWSATGKMSGSESSSKGLEAVKIKLTGELANYYDIYYRAHVQGYGWLGWAKNGQAAGTTKIGYRLEALQIRLVAKDATAPGANSNYYKETKKVTIKDNMHLKAQLYSSNTPYLILVDRNAHKVGVFRGFLGQWQCVYLWDCANGAAGTPTKAGVFTVGNKGYYFDSGDLRCYWYTQFYGNYLFHSVPYSKYNGKLLDGRVGIALSHGCVRLKIENAKWIYDNIPRGTKVVVY